MRILGRTNLGIVASVLLFLCCGVSLAGEPAVQKEIKVTARKFEFEPKTITVQKGDNVKLVVTSEDVDHGIAIEEFGVDQKVAAKKTKVVEFTADRVGKFRISCSVFCGEGHPEMEGELIVTAGAAKSAEVTFDQSNPGVVYVETNGELLRIDTLAQTVSSMSGPIPAAYHPQVAASKPGTRTVASRTDARPRTDASAITGTTTVGTTVQATAQTGTETRARRSEPYDYRLVNVPTPKRVKRHSLNLNFSHRFSEPINDEGAEDFFGLDGFSVSSLGVAFGITNSLYYNFNRSPICDRQGYCKTIEMGLGYHLLDEAGKSPVALSVYGSAEGADNFTENFTFNVQAMVGRSVTKYLNLFFSPAAHIRSNGNGRFNARTPAAAAALELGEHTGSFGFGANARIRPTVSLLAEYTPRIGFKLGQITPVDLAGTVFRNDSEPEVGFGIEKRIGRHSFALTFSNNQATTTSRYNSSSLALPPSKLVIGFNLYRQLF